MKKVIFFLVLIFLVSFTSALCEEGQIDVNSAPKEELQDLYQIGINRSKQIINLRPFESVNGLLEIDGIAETRLENIKNSNPSPCVSINKTDEIQKTENKTSETKDDENNNESLLENTNSEENQEENSDDVNEKSNSEPVTSEIIRLNQKKSESVNGNTEDIKGENDRNLNDKAIYGFIVFCVLLGILIVRKKAKELKNNRTEFDEDETGRE